MGLICQHTWRVSGCETKLVLVIIHLPITFCAGRGRPFFALLEGSFVLKTCSCCMECIYTSRRPSHQKPDQLQMSWNHNASCVHSIPYKRNMLLYFNVRYKLCYFLETRYILKIGKETSCCFFFASTKLKLHLFNRLKERHYSLLRSICVQMVKAVPQQLITCSSVPDNML